MASQDVTRFLASIGSPIVDENVDVPSKKIPSADALKLIDVRIQAHHLLYPFFQICLAH